MRVAATGATARARIETSNKKIEPFYATMELSVFGVAPVKQYSSFNSPGL